MLIRNTLWSLTYHMLIKINAFNSLYSVSCQIKNPSGRKMKTNTKHRFVFCFPYFFTLPSSTIKQYLIIDMRNDCVASKLNVNSYNILTRKQNHSPITSLRGWMKSVADGIITHSGLIMIQINASISITSFTRPPSLFTIWINLSWINKMSLSLCW